MIEKRSLLQSGVPAVQSYYAGKSAEVLALIRNKFGKRVLRDLLRYDPKQNDESFVEGAFM